MPQSGRLSWRGWAALTLAAVVIAGAASYVNARRQPARAPLDLVVLASTVIIDLQTAPELSRYRLRREQAARLVPYLVGVGEAARQRRGVLPALLRLRDALGETLEPGQRLAVRALAAAAERRLRANRVPVSQFGPRRRAAIERAIAVLEEAAR